jgi:hypothetical protein
MVISQLYEDETDWFRHSSAINDLAKNLKVSVEEISRSYEIELRELKKTARIKDFIHLLVTRRVRDLLMKRGRPG